MNVTSPTHTPEQLTDAAESAARETHVRLYNVRNAGKGVAFTLKTGIKGEQREDWRGKLKWFAKYQRLATYERVSSSREHKGERYYPVIPGAVCWHGHRDFFRALYARVPDAKIRTAFITYQNAVHFEDNYELTWNGAPEKASGSFAGHARPYQDACTCDEGGI